MGEAVLRPEEVELIRQIRDMKDGSLTIHVAEGKLVAVTEDER